MARCNARISCHTKNLSGQYPKVYAYYISENVSNFDTAFAQNTYTQAIAGTTPKIVSIQEVEEDPTCPMLT